MLTYIAIDNYKTFGGFKWRPGRVAILLGGNGVGKSAVFEVLERIRELVCGDGTLATCFPYDSRTRWLAARKQTFELRVQPGEHELRYLLTVEHTPNGEESRIIHESLSAGETRLFAFEKGVVKLHDDKGNLRAEFNGAWKKSGLPLVVADKNNPRVTAFKDWLANLLLARPNPATMDGRAPSEDSRLKPDLDNFASWYRHAMLTQPRAMVAAGSAFAEIVPRFRDMTLPVDEQRVAWLKANFDAPGGGSYTLRFEELSDGQRVLFALYAILHAHGASARTLILDEPDNFVALAEIQPFLHEVLDRALSGKGPQLFIVSHHPEYLDQLAPDHGWVVALDDDGATRFARFAADKALPPSALVARGEVGAETPRTEQ